MRAWRAFLFCIFWWKSEKGACGGQRSPFGHSRRNKQSIPKATGGREPKHLCSHSSSASLHKAREPWWLRGALRSFEGGGRAAGLPAPFSLSITAGCLCAASPSSPACALPVLPHLPSPVQLSAQTLPRRRAAIPAARLFLVRSNSMNLCKDPSLPASAGCGLVPAVRSDGFCSKPCTPVTQNTNPAVSLGCSQSATYISSCRHRSCSVVCTWKLGVNPSPSQQFPAWHLSPGMVRGVAGGDVASIFPRPADGEGLQGKARLQSCARCPPAQLSPSAAPPTSTPPRSVSAPILAMPQPQQSLRGPQPHRTLGKGSGSSSEARPCQLAFRDRCPAVIALTLTFLPAAPLHSLLTTPRS